MRGGVLHKMKRENRFMYVLCRTKWRNRQKDHRRTIQPSPLLLSRGLAKQEQVNGGKRWNTNIRQS